MFKQVSRRFVVAIVACLSTLLSFGVTGAYAGGGMIRGSSYTLRGRVVATTASTPSCRSITYPGSAGKISVQTSSNGYVTWGIYMNDTWNRWGSWTVDVFVGKRRVDHKSQDYEPHGTVNPKDAKSGSTFHITATMSNLFGTFSNMPNECIIP